MPTYQYACTACEHRFEAVQKFTDDSLTVCPECAGALRKVYGSVGVVFKGSGFYRTDSRSGPVAAGAEGGSKGGEKSGGDKSSGDKSSDAAASSDKSGSSGSSSESSSGSKAATKKSESSSSGGSSASSKKSTTSSVPA